jgi:hypothetical protein
VVPIDLVITSGAFLVKLPNGLNSKIARHGESSCLPNEVFMAILTFIRLSFRIVCRSMSEVFGVESKRKDLEYALLIRGISR